MNGLSGRCSRRVTYHASKEPVIGEELEPCGLYVRFELVEFNTIAVVDEDIFVLRYCEMRMVLEEPMAWVTEDSVRTRKMYERDISTSLPKLKLCMESACLPVKCCDMTLLAYHGEMPGHNKDRGVRADRTGTYLPLRVYLVRYGPPSIFHSCLPCAAC